MRKQIITLGICSLLGLSLLNSCESASSKENELKENISETKTELSDEVWEAYKNATEAKIDANKEYISNLREAKRNTNDEMTQDAYNAKIDALQERNQQLRDKLAEYPNHKTDWESFKADVNKELDNIGQSLKDLG